MTSYAHPGRRDAPRESVRSEGDGPYEDPLEHLQDFHALVRARGLVLHNQRFASGELRSFTHVEDPQVYVRRAEEARQEAAAIEATLAARLKETRARQPLPIDDLCQRFQLQGMERAALLLGALVNLDLSAEMDYGRLDESAHSLSVTGLFNFLGYGMQRRLSARRLFRTDAPLRANDLIHLGVGRQNNMPEDLLRASIHITHSAFAAILGDGSLCDELIELSCLSDPLADFERVVLPPKDRQRILSVIDGHAGWPAVRRRWGLDGTITYGRGSFLLFSGPPGTGKTLTAHAVAARLGRQVLSVDIPTLASHSDRTRLLPGLFREARVRRAVLFFDECESLFASRRMGNGLMSLLLTELERFDGVAVFATNLVDLLDEAMFRRILVHVRFEAPDAAAREQIWQRHLPAPAPLDADVDLQALAQRFSLTGGMIKNAVLAGCLRAYSERGEEGPITQEDLEQAARGQSLPMEEEASVPRWGEARLSDLHLPEVLVESLQEFVAGARESTLIRETWRTARGASVGSVALLHGPPGTGKTFCAEAIAGELGRPLIHATLGGLRSKWVGESEQNLTELFERAAREGAVLLLDEADTLGATRGDARSAHHDDVLTSTLLTLLDAHEGAVVLTTNRRDALDGALARRIGWSIAFPLPDVEARRGIWRAMLPETMPLCPGLSYARLAGRHLLSGGDIRTVAVRAAARAAARGCTIDEPMIDALAAEVAASNPTLRALSPSPGEA